MSMHRKTDSEGTTSLAPSSPNRPYYVQSPSRDSHDGEKTTNSFQSTPVLSPMGSPGRHSRESSSTRFSGSLKPGSQKSTNNKTRLYPQRKGDNNNNNNNNNKDWKEFDAIEEEGLLDDEVARRGLRRRRLYLLAFFVGFVLLFTFFSLVLWGASRNQKPLVTMKSISFDQFVIQAGSDASGVATDMVSVNSTMQLIFRNKGTFFGVHVTSSPMDLSYTELTLATGEINKFYQSRKSQRTVSIPLIGNRIPLYGGGSNLVNKAGKPSTPVPLTLNFTVKATAYVLGKLVKTKFSKDIGCSLVLDPLKMNTAVSLKNSCTYH